MRHMGEGPLSNPHSFFLSSVHSRNYIYTMKAVKGILSYLVDLDGACGPLRPADLVHTNMFSGRCPPVCIWAIGFNPFLLHLGLSK